MELIKSIISGNFDFTAMRGFIEGLKTRVAEQADVKPIWDMVAGIFESLGLIVPVLLIALGLLEVLFGKKLMPLQRFLFVVATGFVGGVLYIAPILNGFVALNPLIVGVAIAIVGAILNKLCYYVFYIALFGYIGYTVAITGMIPAIGSMFTGNMIFSAVLAVVLVVLALILRNTVERVGTAYIGALLITTNIIKNFFDYTALLGDNGALVGTIVLAVITFIGFVIQVKTRKRY